MLTLGLLKLFDYNVLKNNIDPGHGLTCRILLETDIPTSMKKNYIDLQIMLIDVTIRWGSKSNICSSAKVLDLSYLNSS